MATTIDGPTITAALAADPNNVNETELDDNIYVKFWIHRPNLGLAIVTVYRFEILEHDNPFFSLMSGAHLLDTAVSICNDFLAVVFPA